MARGGFDPSVAAHELVHTAQQGMVSSGVTTMSTPVGGVQMEENDEKKKKQQPVRVVPIKDKWGQLRAPKDPNTGEFIIPYGYEQGGFGAQGLIKHKSLTGGRLMRNLNAPRRHRHEAEEELYRTKRSGEWDELTEEQKQYWIRENKTAWKNYQQKEEKIGQRVKAQDDLTAAAGKFLDEKYEQEGNKRSNLGDMRTVDPNLQVYRGKSSLEKAVDYAAKDVDLLGKAKGDFDKILEQAGGWETAPMSPETLQLQQQNPSEEEDNSEEILNEIIEKGDELHGALNDAGIINTGPLGEFKDLATGFSKAVNNTQKAVEARNQRQDMTAMKKELRGDKDRGELTAEDRIYSDMASQASMADREREIKHTGKAIEGGTRAVGAVLGMAGQEVPSKIVKGLGKGIRYGTDAAARHQHKRMEHKTVEQTHLINSDSIEEFMERNQMEYNADNYSEAKRALMRSQGAETGFRAEGAAFETELRAEMLARDAKNGNTKALRILNKHGIQTDGVNDLDPKEIAQKVFNTKKTRGDIAGKKFTIKAMAAENRRSREALAAQQPAQTPAPVQPQENTSGSESGSDSGHRKHRRHHRRHSVSAETVVMPEIDLNAPDMDWLMEGSNSESGSDRGHRKHRRHRHRHSASAETVVMPEIDPNAPDMDWLMEASGFGSGSDSGHRKHRQHHHR